jgi:hypothetical protein
MMTEVQMSEVLGLLSDPIHNFVKMDALLEYEILSLKSTFAMLSIQKKMIGTVNPDLWCEFMPWNSLN